MQCNIKQKRSMTYKGFEGTVFYSKLYDNYFGWVRGVEGLLYYEYSTMEMLRFVFHQTVDEYLRCREHVPHGYTNTEYFFAQLTKGRKYSELTDEEKELYEGSLHRYWDWNSVISSARREATESGEDYRFMRSISEIHDSALEIGCTTATFHIAESLLSNGVDPGIVKKSCSLTEDEMKIVSDCVKRDDANT